MNPMVEAQIIKSKKETKRPYPSRQREPEIVDLVAHNKWLENYNHSCQTDARQNAWREKHIVVNGILVSRK